MSKWKKVPVSNLPQVMDSLNDVSVKFLSMVGFDPSKVTEIEDKGNGYGITAGNYYNVLKK